GPLFIAPLVALVGHAIIRHRLMDLRLFINRGLAYALTTVIASAVLITISRWIIPDTQTFSLNAEMLIVGVVILALLSSPWQRFFSRVIDPYLFRGRIDHASALRHATRQLTRLMQPHELSATLRQILTEAFVPESFSMSVLPSQGKALEQPSEGAPAGMDLQTLVTLLTDGSSPMVIVAIDISGRITSFNPAATKLLSLTERHRGALLDVLPSEVGWALAFAAAAFWQPRDAEVTIDHDQRGVLHVILSTAVLHDDEARVTGALVVVTDLSAVKTLEKNQRRIEHFAIMARFYAGLAHEIRNPLAAISNFIS